MERRMEHPFVYLFPDKHPNKLVPRRVVPITRNTFVPQTVRVPTPRTIAIPESVPGETEEERKDRVAKKKAYDAERKRLTRRDEKGEIREMKIILTRMHARGICNTVGDVYGRKNQTVVATRSLQVLENLLKVSDEMVQLAIFFSENIGVGQEWEPSVKEKEKILELKRILPQ